MRSTDKYRFALVLALLSTSLALHTASAVDVTVQYNCVLRHFGPRGEQFSLTGPRKCTTTVSFLVGGFAYLPRSVSCTVPAGTDSCSKQTHITFDELANPATGQATYVPVLSALETRLSCGIDPRASSASISCDEDFSYCDVLTWQVMGCAGRLK